MFDFFKTLWNHRAIIKRLEEEKVWISTNAFNVINLVNKYGMSLRIEAPDEMFGWLIRLRVGIGKKTLQSSFISERKIPPSRRIEYAIKQMADFAKKARKEKKSDSNNSKG